MRKGPKKQVIAIDAETDPFLAGRIPKPFLWGIYDGFKFQSFRKTTELAAFLKAGNYLAYAHNGGKFDFEFLLDFADKDQELRIINGRLAQFKIGNSILRDSWCIYPQALATFKKDEIDYAKFEVEVREKHIEEITRYLETDVKSLYEIVTDFRATYGNGLTLAGAAMKYWQKHCDIKAPRSTRGYFDNMSKYYYGGRVECFQKGVFKFEMGRPLNSYDIVSAFPHAMCNSQPWGMECDGLAEWPRKNEYFRCLFSIVCRSFGAFPYRSKNGLSFPHDGERRTFHVTGWEILAALEARDDWDMELIKCYRFKETYQFDDYVNHFFDMKKNAKKDSTERQFAKLMLNSLYGKFASCPGPKPKFDETGNLIQKKFDEIESTNYQKYLLKPIGSVAPEGYKLCGRGWPWDFFSRDLDENECRYFDVTVGAAITGFVRARLYREFVKNFGTEFWKNENLYYCDTDNIKGKGLSIPESKALGGWEKEGTYILAAFAGKKMYTLKDAQGKEINRSKGVKLTHKELLRVAAGETVEYENPAPSISALKGIRFVKRRIKMT